MTQDLQPRMSTDGARMTAERTRAPRPLHAHVREAVISGAFDVHREQGDGEVSASVFHPCKSVANLP
jgi:hypothetical protein